MHAHCLIVHNPLNPALSREYRPVRRPCRVRALAPATQRPYICYLNGRPLLRAGWRRRLNDGDQVAFVVLPLGDGGGSNPLKAILMIAVMMVAGPIAASLPGAGTTLFGEITLGSLYKAGIGLLGSMLVNAIIPPPKPPTPQVAASLAAPSPTYSLNAQGNLARLEEPVPVQYGRMIAYPDFAAQPYTEYAGNEQYLYQLLCIGLGEYSLEAIRIEDTPISSFEEIDYEIIEPGGSISLFPSNVITAGEVSGQELLQGDYLGPFVANAAGSTANTIGIDLVAPRGLYYANDSGGLDHVSVQVQIQAREIDEMGDPLGSWVTLATETITAATNTPQRRSYRYSVNAGRYEVQATRLDTKQTDSRYGHEIVWAALRAYLPENRTWDDVTLLAMRLRATNNLSSQASRKINVISTRKLKTWNPTTGWDATPTVSRSIAWAFADAARASYGAELDDARIDLEALYQLDQTWTARGDTFDGRFDNLLTCWEGLTKILQAGRATPYLQGGILRAARDQSSSVPVCLFSPRNIVRGSLSIEYMTPSADTADAVEVAYFDEDYWTTRRVMAVLAGSTSNNPARVSLFGVTDRSQAHREGLYHAAANRYRRRFITFQTELEGMIPSFGDLIAITHDLPQWGQSGEVVGWDSDDLILTLSEPVTWETGQTHYIGLRARDGSVSGPYVATAGVDDYHVVIDAAPDITPYTGDGEERTHYAFGYGETWRQLARVIRVTPRDIWRVEIEAVNEDPSVHTADQGVTLPPVQSSQLTVLNTAPVVAGLVTRSAPGKPEQMLLSWQPAPGADRYLIEQSEDGENWTRTGESRTSNYAATAIYGAQTIVRVAAEGLTRGPWVQVAYGDSADYMWVNDADPMWSTDTELMWRY